MRTDGDGSCLGLLRGGDYFRSSITHIDSAESTITTTLRPLAEAIDHNRSGWVGSDDDARTFWRATYLGEGRFRLDGPPVAEQAFGEANVLRLWEYGAGDTVRQSTSVSLRRNQDMWEVTSDVTATISLPCPQLEISRDGSTWRAAAQAADDGWCSATVPPCDDVIYLR
jgi:hypothetical protein